MCAPRYMRIMLVPCAGLMRNAKFTAKRVNSIPSLTLSPAEI